MNGDDEVTAERRRLLDAMAVLHDVVAAPELLDSLDAEEKAAFFNAAGDVFCPDPEIRRRRTKLLQRRRRNERARRDDEVLAETGIRTLRSKPVFTTPDVYAPIDFDQVTVDDAHREPFRESVEPQHCYICKRRYRAIHHFYDQLCLECASLNFAKRSELADMSGMVVLLTGGRVKIGYQAGIKLLRCGAELIVATRFPRDAAARYAAEADFGDWADRLDVFGLDLRHTPSVEAFAAHVSRTRHRLDAIVNNACQTVRRPPGFYEHMIESETSALTSMPDDMLALVGSYEVLRGEELRSADSPTSVLDATGSVGSDNVGLDRPAELSQTVLLPDDAAATGALFPEGQLDQDMQQVDLRGRNSWRLQMHEVSSVELLETQLVNAVAPFVLNARLKPLMESTPGDHKHIVNVSAVEGQFYRPRKTTRHPHTNMAKAALNMMTRTSATDYHASGINMNSVDTGWVNDEDPVPIAAAKTAEHRFHPPLDIVDGAARITDPIISGLNSGTHVWGEFLKDFAPTDW